MRRLHHCSSSSQPAIHGSTALLHRYPRFGLTIMHPFALSLSLCVTWCLQHISADPSGLEALLFTAEGDMRNALNNLQVSDRWR